MCFIGCLSMERIFLKFVNKINIRKYYEMSTNVTDTNGQNIVFAFEL